MHGNVVGQRLVSKGHTSSSMKVGFGSVTSGVVLRILWELRAMSGGGMKKP